MTESKRSKITEEHLQEAARLKALWDSRPHPTQAVFGELYQLGNQANVGHYLNGRSPLNPKAAAAFATELKCSVTEFSPRVAREIERLSASSAPYANTEPGPDLRGKVPLISWVRAGEWCEAEDPFQPGDAERWMDCPVSHSSSTFALRVRGDSMTAPHGNSRTYPEGCIIFVDPERRTPVNGDRVVACLEGSHEVTFKVYKNEDGRQWLQPLNPSHEPIREPFKVLGTVLGKWEDG